MNEKKKKKKKLKINTHDRDMSSQSKMSRNSVIPVNSISGFLNFEDTLTCTWKSKLHTSTIQGCLVINLFDLVGVPSRAKLQLLFFCQ